MDDRTCEVEGCARPPKQGRMRYCSMHTERLRRTGELGPAESVHERAQRSVCAVEDCDRRARNLISDHCKLHDYRYQKFGSTEKPPAANLITKKVCRECGHDGDNFYGYLKSTCIPCYRKYQRGYDARYKEQRGFGKTREWALRKCYGITLADFDRMMAEQGGVCAICGALPPSGKNLHVDHDHETGKVRGLLCNGCNRALGFLSDNAATARAAAVYLDFHQRFLAEGR